MTKIIRIILKEMIFTIIMITEERKVTKILMKIRIIIMMMVK